MGWTSKEKDNKHGKLNTYHKQKKVHYIFSACDGIAIQIQEQEC